MSLLAPLSRPGSTQRESMPSIRAPFLAVLLILPRRARRRP